MPSTNHLARRTTKPTTKVEGDNPITFMNPAHNYYAPPISTLNAVLGNIPATIRMGNSAGPGFNPLGNVPGNSLHCRAGPGNTPATEATVKAAIKKEESNLLLIGAGLAGIIALVLVTMK